MNAIHKTIIHLAALPQTWGKRLLIVALIAILASCKMLQTNIAINSKPLPEKFTTNPDTATIAKLKWRQYFSDPQLQQLIDTAVANNPDLQMALQRIELFRAGIRTANGNLLPQVGVNINGGVRKFGLYTMDGAGNITTEITPGKLVPINLPDYYTGLQATWEADIWGKLRNQRKSAIANYLASVEGTHFVISNLVTEVAITYYELQALDNSLEIILQTITKQQEAFEVIQLQKNAGRANELAVQQFKAQLLHTQSLEKESRQQITEIENKINFLLGQYPQTVSRTKQPMFQSLPLQIAIGLPTSLLANRPDIREAEQIIQASRFDVKAAKAAFMPNLSLSTAFGFQAFKPNMLFLTPASTAYSVLGGFAAPLLNRNELKAQFNTAKANQLTALHNYQKTVLNAFIETQNQLSALQNLRDIGTLKKEQTDVLTQSAITATELYNASKANYLEVLLAQQNALQANLELVEVNKRQQIATVNIYKILGGGWQ